MFNFVEDQKRPFEEWFAEKPNKNVVLPMFYMGLKWAQGKLVTEGEYDAAVAAMLGHPIGYQVQGVKP